MKKEWSEFDLNYLKENYSNNFNYDIAKFLNRSVESITNKANKLKLKKNKTHISKYISRRNVLVGHQWTKLELSNIAIKYKSRSEFQKNNSAAYCAAKKMGMLDEICSHMVSKSFSIPQIILKKIINDLFKTELLYNNRQILKPYEVDVYLPKLKLGFEYNGKGWHKNNQNDFLKSKIADEKNITLITINENNRDYINDIKHQLIGNLNIINKYIKINEEDILKLDVDNPYKDVYDINDLILTCEKYNSFKDFYKNEYSVYYKIRKLNLLEKCTAHMCCRRKKRELNEVKEKISNYEYLIDLIKKDNPTYLFIKKNKLDYLISDLKRLN